MNILILAGGFATRLWPLTEHRAKPLLLLSGKTILAHILDQVPLEANIFLLTNKKFEADFQAELKKLKRKAKIFCEDSFSDHEKLGALGAVSLAIKHFKIKDSAIVMAGDNLLPGLNIEQLACGDDEAMVAVREIDDLHEARKFGVVELSSAIDLQSKSRQGIVVESFEEKPAQPKSKIISTGFFALGKDLFPLLHEVAAHSSDALGGIFPELLKKKKTVLATKVEGEWFDVGSFETYLSAHETLQSDALQIGENVKSFGNTFSGKIFIGDGAKVHNCRLHNAIVYPGTTLKDCHVSESVIDEKCRLRGVDVNRKLVRRRTKLES